MIRPIDLPSQKDCWLEIYDVSSMFCYGGKALPGGIGAFEELSEVYTLSQLGFHCKACGLLNVNNCYPPPDALPDNAEREGLLKSPHRNALIRADNSADVMSRMVGRL